MSENAHQRIVRDESTDERRALWSMIESAASRAPSEHPEDEDLRRRVTKENDIRVEND